MSVETFVVIENWLNSCQIVRMCGGKVRLERLESKQNTIMVVDDEPKIRRLLARTLEADGHKVVEAENSAEMDKIMASQPVDLITLDLQLGVENGLTIAAALRGKSNIPIVMVTGKGDVIDKVVGLEMGADDYITKPFHIREVQARIRTVLRRVNSAVVDNGVQAPPQDRGKPAGTLTEGKNDQCRKFEGWVANLETYMLQDPAGEECVLTTTEFKLLRLFLEAPKRVLSRDHMMDALNGQDWAPYDRAIDNQVARLRKKIETDPANPKIIKTIRGVGYMFATDVIKL